MSWIIFNRETREVVRLDHADESHIPQLEQGVVAVFNADLTEWPAQAEVRSKLVFDNTAGTVVWEALPIAVPTSVSMKQARLALLADDLLTTVETNISGMDKASQINWEFSTTVTRNDPLTVSIAALLLLDEAALDTLFINAAKL